MKDKETKIKENPKKFSGIQENYGTKSIDEILNVNLNKEKNTYSNISQKETSNLKKSPNSTNGIYYVIIIILIGIVLFFIFNDRNNYNNISTGEVIDEFDGIDIFDVSEVMMDGNNKLKVKIYNDTGVDVIVPDEIKVVTQGVTWVGKTKKLGFFNYYTLYIIEEQYNALDLNGDNP